MFVYSRLFKANGIRRQQNAGATVQAGFREQLGAKHVSLYAGERNEMQQFGVFQDQHFWAHESSTVQDELSTVSDDVVVEDQSKELFSGIFVQAQQGPDKSC